MPKTLSGIVFSFNRACQLDLLLRSFREKLVSPDDAEIAVYYRSTSEELEAGYRRVSELHPWARLVREREDGSKKEQLLELMDEMPAKYFAYFVDDDVIIDSVSFDEPAFRKVDSDPMILGVSMRVHPKLTHCQPEGRDVPPPPLSADLAWLCRAYPVPGGRLVRKVVLKLVPRLRQARGDWAVAFSVDGNVLPYQRYRDSFASIPEFKKVTQIEPLLEKVKFPQAKLVCFERPKLINVALNRVDTQYNYPAGEISVEELNRLFLEGKRLDYPLLEDGRARSCHLIADPRWL